MAKKSASSPNPFRRRFAGKTFALAGLFFTPRHHLWEQAGSWIRACGGEVIENVTADLDYLVVGWSKTPTPAEKMALQLNHNGAAIALITPMAFLALFKPTPEETLALLTGGAQGLTLWQTLDNCWALESRVELLGIDLRNAHLSVLDLTGIFFSGVDFRGATLHQTRIVDAENCNFDSAILTEARIAECRCCSFRKADLTKAHVIDEENCDFTEARFTKGVFHGCRAAAVFVGADLSEVRFMQTGCSAADFSSANLTGAQLLGCDFTGAKFCRANLTRANLCSSNLSLVDLTDASLRETNLADACLQGANLAGADLVRANLWDADLAGVDLSRVKNLNAEPYSSGAIGPKIRQLAQLMRSSVELNSSALLSLDGDRVSVSIAGGSGGAFLSAQTWGPHDTHHLPAAPSFAQGMINLAKLWSRAQLQLTSIHVSAKKCSLGHQDLLDLATAAWCEAFGVPLPTPEALVQQRLEVDSARRQTHEEMLGELRQGPAGVKRWNTRPREERKNSGHFRGADLAGMKLAGIDLDGLDFRGAIFDRCDLQNTHLNCDLRGASLKGAQLDGANFGGANLADADFSGASLHNCKLWSVTSLGGVNFQGADLSGSRFSHLCGVDLSGANLADIVLESARYDEKTRFPPGFALPPGIRWAGAGPDSRRIPEEKDRLAPGSITFEEFLAHLRKLIDPALLARVLKAVNSEQFTLFAAVEADALVGVVKNRTSSRLAYSCRLTSSGSFCCCNQDLDSCRGLRGALCKHLLVVILGLTRAGKIDPATVHGWIQLSQARRPTPDKDALAVTFLRCKEAIAEQIDWRPAETIPEDYSSL